MELLELYLSPLDNPTEFKVIVTHSPAGEGESKSSLPFLDAKCDWRTTVIRTLDISSFNPESFSAEGEQEWMIKAGILGEDSSIFHPNYLVNIGQALYNALFPQGSKVEQLLQQSIGFAESKSTKLVVRLKLEADVVQKTRLADYPWELLYNRYFLCHHQVEFSRYIAYQAVPPSLPTAEKLNVLLVSSGASNKELNLGVLSKKEQKAVLKGLKTASERGDISLEQLKEPTFDELRTYLTEHPGDKAPHVLHFDGHGLFGKPCPNPECGAMNAGTKLQRCRKCGTELPSAQGYLVFEDEDGDADYISARELGSLLHQFGLSDGDSKTQGVVLVVLSACHSGRVIAGESIFNGAAQNLIAHRVPAVVAMQYSVNVDSATQFTEQFYRSLGQKNSLAVAVSQGRGAMGVEGNQWYRPVLYLRWQDNEGGQLFASPTVPQSIPENFSRRSGAKEFVGRDKAMDTLHQQLQTTERVAITSILTGMGGIGKTELALQYAPHHLQQKTYSGGVCWLNVRGVDVGIQIVNFAKSQLDLNPPEDYDLQTQVAYCWRNWLQGDVLVIFDDVVEYGEISDFLPPGEPRFKVLITTRQKHLGQSFHKLELQVLDEDAALKLLVSFVGETRIQQEIEEAKALCADLGFLPLGLELVARYLERKPHLSVAKVRQRLESKRLEHQSLEAYSQDMTAERGVAAAFELSWQQLDEDEQELGRLLSLFAPAAIPWYLVAECLPEVDEEDLEDRRDDGLVNLSLLQRVGEESYELHPLIREFFRGKLSESDSVEEMKRSICRVMVAEAKKIPQRPIREQILAVEPAIPHLEEVAENLTDWLTDEDLILPFVGLGKFYEGQGFYQSAQPWYEKCLDITKSRLGQASRDIAASLNNLALLYGFQGRYTEAEPLFLEALEMTKQLLGSAHPDIAASLNNLASLYKSQGRYTEAEPLYLQALEMTKQLLGLAHPSIATSLSNLALLYSDQGRYTKAEPLFLEALEMRKQLLGSAHPDIAASLNNLALLYSDQGRYTKAEPLFLEALEMRKQLLGLAHPSIATSLNNLAVLYSDQGRYTEAEPLYLQALEMTKQLLGSPHPDIASSLNNLASLYKFQGRYKEAEPLFLEALEMRKQLLGSAHPSIAASLNNLASLYKSQGRYTEAEPLYLEAVTMLVSQLGEEHPNTQTGWQNYLYFLQQVVKENRRGELSDERSLQIISQMEIDAEE